MVEPLFEIADTEPGHRSAARDQGRGKSRTKALIAFIQETLVSQAL